MGRVGKINSNFSYATEASFMLDAPSKTDSFYVRRFIISLISSS